jgi:hypothetical protein
MIETTKYLVQATHARIGYTQSDEISLVWLADGLESDVFFSGKVQKMVSVLASMAATKFVTVIPAEYRDRLPHSMRGCSSFHRKTKRRIPSSSAPWTPARARSAWWRKGDSRRRRFTARIRRPCIAMLADVGVDFEADYPTCLRRGTFIRRNLTERLLTEEELAQISESHRPTDP